MRHIGCGLTKHGGNGRAERGGGRYGDGADAGRRRREKGVVNGEGAAVLAGFVYSREFISF